MKIFSLAVLPLAFLLAACGGHEETATVPASSDSAPVTSGTTGTVTITSSPVTTSAAPVPSQPAPSAVALAPSGTGGLAVSGYQSARGTKTSPIVLQQQPQQAVNLADALASIPRVTPQQAKAKVDKGEALIVDVRSIIHSQITGSRHIPLAQLPLLMKDLPRDKEIVTYCTCPHEEEATRGALELKQAGFKNAVALAGGLHAWEQAGYATEPPQ
jgi:rhodanese-related sulfurtransferase